MKPVLVMIFIACVFRGSRRFSAFQNVCVSLLVLMLAGCLSVQMPLCCYRLQTESGSREVRKQELLSGRLNAEMITSVIGSLSAPAPRRWRDASSVQSCFGGSGLTYVYYRNLDQLLHC